MNKKILMLNFLLVLLCVTSHAEDDSKKSQKVFTLAGSTYCGYETHESGDYWSMAITVASTNKGLFDVVWTKPLSKLPPPYDNTYRLAETLVMKSSDGKKVKFIRPNWRQYYEADVDSNGNLINGTVSEIESGKTTKSVWSLFKVK
jgi:hypothetical protein